MPKTSRPASLPILFSVVVVDLIGFGIVLPVLPFWADHYGANGLVLGVLFTCYAAMQFIFGPLWGRLSDRVGRRPVMLATIAGTSAALWMLGWAPSLAWLFVARILGGIFGANISVASAYLTDVTEESERTRWMGMLGASFGVGFLLGPAIGGLLAPYGYHVPMFAAAGLALVNLAWAAGVLKEPPNHRLSQESGMGRREVLADPFVRRMSVTYFAFTFAVTQLETIFAFFMLHRFDYDAPQVAWLLVLMALTMMLIQGGAIRRLAARYGERRLLLSGSLLLAVAFAAVPFAASVPLLLVPLLLSAAGRAIAQPSMMSMVSMTASPSSRGAVMGTFQSSASLARVFGPLAAGALYDQHHAAPFWLASLLMFLAVGVARGGAQTQPRRDGQTNEATSEPGPEAASRSAESSQNS